MGPPSAVEPSSAQSILVSPMRRKSVSACMYAPWRRMSASMMPHDGPWLWNAAVSITSAFSGSFGRLRPTATVSITVFVITTVSRKAALSRRGGSITSS